MSREEAELPPQFTWTVTWDEKNAWTVRSIGRDLTPDSKPPQIRTGAADFVTWMGPSLFRPLVAISQPNYSDPDRWKPFVPDAPLGRQAHQAFREAVELDPSCSGKLIRDYPKEYILLRPKAYRSARGDVLLALRGTRPGTNAGLRMANGTQSGSCCAVVPTIRLAMA